MFFLTLLSTAIHQWGQMELTTEKEPVKEEPKPRVTVVFDKSPVIRPDPSVVCMIYIFVGHVVV